MMGGSINTNILSNSEDTFQSGWDAAKQRLINSGHLGDYEDEIKHFNGIVVMPGKGAFELALDRGEIADPLSDPKLNSRNVKIGDQTKIIIATPKDEEVYQQEQEAYSAAWVAYEQALNAYQQEIIKLEGLPESERGEYPQSPMPPTEISACTEKEGTMDDLEERDIVLVITEEDVKNKKEFTAKEVRKECYAGSIAVNEEVLLGGAGK